MLLTWNPDRQSTIYGAFSRHGIGPALVTLRGETSVDITNPAATTMRDLMELDETAAHVRAAIGEEL
ncbi:fumarylacetoacetate hydrolase, partial [Marinovum sp. 1_MG-2023]|nr:fumarylacetoacetate hydrolase [Marinovum sp. 1_MG-2023]